MRDDSWMSEANCRNADQSIFHSDEPADIAEAKGVCRDCPLTQECLSWAIDTKNEGVAGGLTHRERRKLSRHIAQGRVTLNEWNMSTRITLRKNPRQ